MENLSFINYMLVLFCISIICSLLVLLTFILGEYIVTKFRRKKRKTVWDLGEK